MTSLKSYVWVMVVLALTMHSNILAQKGSQNPDAIFQDSALTVVNNNDYKLSYKNLILPTVFIGYGVLSMKINALKQLNISTKNEIIEDQFHTTTLDNYFQFVPAVLVYGLNAAGIKGKHNFWDRSVIYATSQLISLGLVMPLKHIVKEERPDGSNHLSFPSGHTSIAFSSAQFMFREYKDTDFWLSISGYPFAIFTGVYRSINNKHWVGDIVAGAGFGILSTELVYWLYPKINRLLTGEHRHSAIMVMPFYQNSSIGIGFIRNF